MLSVGKVGNNWNSHTLLLGIEIDKTTLKNFWQALIKS